MNELILSNGLLLLGYTFYRVYLQRYGNPKTNRIFLSSWVVISAMLPLLPTPSFPREIAADLPFAYTLPAIQATIEGSVNTMQLDWLLIGYLVVSCLIIGKVLRQVYSMTRIISKSQTKVYEENLVYISDEVKMPFSFFRFIVIPGNMDDEELSYVVAHEQAHVQAGHTIDLLLIQLFQAFCWFNPVAWIYERAVRMNHEFEADQAVLRLKSNVANYKELLLSRAMSVPKMMIGHSMADQSQLQKRFLQMNTSRKNSFWNYSMLIPLLVVALVGKSCAEEEAVADDTIVKEEKASVTNTEGKILNGNEVDILPEFPGGMEELVAFLGSTIKYPETAKEDGTEGRVYVEFIVNEEGYVLKAIPINSVREDIDKEAVRAVLEMPKWYPGEKDGQKVPVKMVLPIVFKL